ncbi:hypothetical protein BGW42_006000 [Actinomortierella wolfii]|nr:hypothetical protein BGW42_006000 [Actinomortierella wolfii]
MPTLTTDCLVRVIDFVEDSGTLFSLLTVSKSVFEIAVRALYHRPFLFETITKERIFKLTCLVYSLVPPDVWDTPGATVNLRQYLPPQKLFPKTYINYIDLVRDIRTSRKRSAWALAHITQTKNLIRSRNFQPILAWAMASHRLEEIQALTIHEAYAQRLQERIHQLTSLRRLCVFYEPPSFRLDEFLQEFVRVHGVQGQRRLRLEFRGEMNRNAMGYLSTYALLDPHGIVAPRHIELSNFVPLYAYRDKVDFRPVKAVYFYHTSYDVLLKEVLPKCYNLETLAIILTTRDINLLDWAVERQIQQLSARINGDNAISQAKDDSHSLYPPLPPLKEIALDGDTLVMAETLDQVFQAFGSTIERVTMGDAALHDHEPPDVYKGPYLRQTITYRLSPGLYLPKLRYLCMDVQGSGIAFQPEDGTGDALAPVMPVLEELTLFKRFERDSADTAMSGPPQMWPVMNLPRLKTLRLNGRAAAEFNPASLASASSSLILLHLHMRTLEWSELWRHDLWTWKWGLNSLTELELGGLAAVLFDLHALEYLPALSRLVLECPGGFESPFVPQYPKHFSDCDSNHPNHSNYNMNNSGSDTSNSIPPSTDTRSRNRPGASVKELCLRGSWVILDHQWQSLLHDWFPELKTLESQDHLTEDILVAMEWVRRHPRIQYWRSRPRGNVSPEMKAMFRAKSHREALATLGKEFARLSSHPFIGVMHFQLTLYSESYYIQKVK